LQRPAPDTRRRTCHLPSRQLSETPPARLSRVERTLEKLTIDVEDEAKSFLKHRLRELGLSVELTSLILPDLELNIYGVSGDVCIIGEATVRAGVSILEDLIDKFEKLKKMYPDRLRRKIILVIYASLPTVELIEEAKKRGIWVLFSLLSLRRL
jgi:hypothetical protein